MTTYIIRRAIQSMIIMVLVSWAVFLLLRLLPGDPLLIYIYQNDLQNLSPTEMQALRVEFGLDKSLPEQYVNWVSDVARFDFGTSLGRRLPVIDIIKERMPITIHLSLVSVVLSTFLGLLFGIIAALKRGSWLDVTVTSVANIGIATPSFWVALLLMYLISFKLGLLPIEGYISPLEDFWGSTQTVILPVFILSWDGIAGLARLTRTQMLEVARQDYIRTARSKGLREHVVIIRHMLKNAMLPLVSNLGMRFRSIFSGSVLIETVFNIPGMGRVVVEATFGQDYTVVQAVALISAFLVVWVNLAVDIAYTWVDPRIKFGRAD